MPQWIWTGLLPPDCASARECSDDLRNFVPRFPEVHFATHFRFSCGALNQAKHNIGSRKLKLHEYNKQETNILSLRDFSRVQQDQMQ